MLRFYSTQIDDTNIVLNENDSRHAVKVLRLKEGATVEVVDGLGTIYQVEIAQAHAKKCLCRIVDKHNETPLPYSLHMAVAPTKNIDRFEWFLEKATEMGITEITPVLCDNSERKNIKLDRLERILVSAMKQSLKATKPVLNHLTPLNDFLALSQKGEKLMAHCEAGEKGLISNYAKNVDDLIILIGPEGDFSPTEINLAKEYGYTPLSFGPSRLRTETAAVFAVASVYNTSIKE